jgi:hypothetical protein
MRTIKIFLASSAELDSDKEQVELFVSRKNKDYNKKRVFLELSTWKDFISSMTEEHSQEKYNQYIRSCDIAVFLFHTRLGRFTKEEFDTAHTTYLKSSGTKKKPMVYTFFKYDAQETLEISEFKTYVDSLNHFYDTYTSMDDLFVKLNRQLDKLENENIIKPEPIDVPKIVKYAVYYFLLPSLVLGGSLMAYYYYQPTDLTVKIIEAKAIPNLPFKEGIASLTYGDKTETLTINDEVIFKQIPSKYKRKQLNLKFSARGFVPVDTLITAKEFIELSIKRDNSLGVVFGIVQDEDRKPLQGVLVAYKELKSMTDQDGRFRIEIPIEFQSDSINIIATKAGYNLWEWSGAPSQNTAWEIQLQRISNL